MPLIARHVQAALDSAARWSASEPPVSFITRACPGKPRHAGHSVCPATIMLKKLLVSSLVVAPMAPVFAEPILSASTEVTSPGERIPPPGLVESMLETAEVEDINSLSECVKAQVLSKKDSRRLFRSVELPRLTPNERIYFLRPALTPYCFTFYGAHVFRYWLIAESGASKPKSFSVLWAGGGDSFEVMKSVMNGRYDIAETNCTASTCRTHQMRFNGRAYADDRCTQTGVDRKGRETVRDGPCT